MQGQQIATARPMCCTDRAGCHILSTPAECMTLAGKEDPSLMVRCSV